MKKSTNLKVLVFVFVVVFVLSSIAFNYAQSQVKLAKKPNKPPGQDNPGNYTWKVVILDNPAWGEGLIGLEGARYDSDLGGWVYSDTDPNVNVGVEIRRAMYDGVEKYWTRFNLEIFYPSQVGFDFIPYAATFYGESGEELCKYPPPGTYDETDPNSMLDFMFFEPHPRPEYEKVRFRFNTDRSVDQSAIDYTQWLEDYHSYMGFSGQVSGRAPDMFKPKTCEDLNLFEYSHIEFGGGDYGYFERLGDDVWKVYVGAERDGYDYTTQAGEGDDAWSTDWWQQCVVTQVNKKQTSATYDAIFSSQGSLDIKFAVLFIREKL